MYYVWTIASNYPNSCWLQYDWKNNPNYLQFLDNKKIVTPTKNIVFNLNKKIKLNTFLRFDYVMSDAMPLINEKLASIILNYAPKDIELIKAIVYQGSNTVGIYFIPLFLQVVDCIDKKKSVYDKDLDDYTKIVFKPESLENKIIVKAKSYEDNNPIVQEIFVNICKNEGINGIDFYKEPFINPLYAQ